MTTAVDPLPPSDQPPDQTLLTASPGAEPETDPTSAKRSGLRWPSVLQRRWFRWLVAVVVVVALMLVAVSLLAGTVGAQQADDPSSVTRTGSAGVAQLLRDQGVNIIRTDDLTQAGASAKDSTLLIVRPDHLQRAELRRLLDLDPALVVLVRPDAATLTELGIGGGPGDLHSVGGETTEPACADPDAQRAGSILVPAGSISYSLPTTSGCYPSVSGGTVFQRFQVDGHPVDVLGAPPRNETLDQQGNAAFALGLLGSRSQLVWLMAPLETAATDQPGLLPDWWIIVVAQAVIGVIVLALWRGRRLGPIISERLPVVVRASETVEGHGHLYHRLSARDRAAAALRTGVRARLGPRYGQPTGTSFDAEALGQQLAARTGRDPVWVQSLLNGPPPTDDEQLIHLARNLDQLEQEAQQL